MESRRLNQPTDFADRTHFVLMWMAGMSSRAIARETGKSVTTVCRWIRRWKQDGNVNTKPRCGRPRLREKRRREEEVEVSSRHHYHNNSVFLTSSSASPSAVASLPTTFYGLKKDDDVLCQYSCCRPEPRSYCCPVSESQYFNLMSVYRHPSSVIDSSAYWNVLEEF